MKSLATAAAGLFAVAAPLGIAIGSAAPAAADPGGVCVSGPFVEGCVQAPGWVGWYDGPWWRDGWHHGDGDDQGEDD